MFLQQPDVTYTGVGAFVHGTCIQYWRVSKLIPRNVTNFLAVKDRGLVVLVADQDGDDRCLDNALHTQRGVTLTTRDNWFSLEKMGQLRQPLLWLDEVCTQRSRARPYWRMARISFCPIPAGCSEVCTHSTRCITCISTAPRTSWRVLLIC